MIWELRVGWRMKSRDGHQTKISHYICNEYYQRNQTIERLESRDLDDDDDDDVE